MSDMAKKARAAMKAKAKSLTANRPLERVDSSTFTPPELLNADVKTGMRPISRRAYKSGGKVEGAKAPANMGKSVRSGNKPVTADSFINRNMKDANQEREGIKHIGGLKRGGRTKKEDGGSLAGAASMMQKAQNTANVPASTLDSVPATSRLSRATGLKKGGKVHEDVAEDKALIKKMVKAEARTARKEGGGVFTGPGYPGKVPGVVPGGRSPHARGGKAGKGKTNINILIGAGKPADMAPNPMGGPTPPPGIPIAVPPPAGGPPGGAPMPMPMPMPGPAGPPGPPGMPMPRKSGGRTYRSYKDMDAGAGSGEGRLEKTEIASRRTKVLPGNY